MRDSSRGVWRQVAVQTARDLWTSSVLEWASSLAFYGVLSLFPLLIAGMVAASYITDVQWATDQAIGLLGLIGLALASRRLLALLWDTLQALPGPDGPVAQAVGGLVRVALLLSIFSLVYAFVPRGTRLWRAVLTGAGLATLLYLAAQFVFSLLAGTIWTNLSLVYGPLALAALLLTWFWYVALITLVGAGFASHVKVMIIERQSGRQAGRQHTRT